MTTETKTPPVSRAKALEALAAADQNASAAAKSLGVNPRTFRHWVQNDVFPGDTSKTTAKRKVVKSVSVAGSISEKTLALPEDKILKSYGYDPNDYKINKIALSERDGGTVAAPKITRSVSMDIVPKPDPVLPAFEGRPIVLKYNRPTGGKAKRKKEGSELVLIVGDYHAPFHDLDLHYKVLSLIRKYRPDRIIINGDLVDFPTVGRHAKVTNAATATANECIQAGGKIIEEIRLAAGPDCIIQFNPGNHDAWLNNYAIQNAEEVYNICRYGDDVNIVDLGFLCRFDDFNVEMTGDISQWQSCFVQLTPHLTVFHGGPINKDAGGSALKAMIDGQGAYISNHIHRAAIVGKTVWWNGEKRTYLGGEAACMCQMNKEGFPTYMDEPNWQQGCMTVEIEKSGHYSLDLATYQNGVLMYRGEQIEA